jgi:hypothetical protein
MASPDASCTTCHTCLVWPDRTAPVSPRRGRVRSGCPKRRSLRGAVRQRLHVRTPVRTRGRAHRCTHSGAHGRAHRPPAAAETDAIVAVEPRCSPLSISHPLLRLTFARLRVRAGSLPRRPSAFTTHPSLPPCLRAPPSSLLALPLSLLLAVVLVVLVLVCRPSSPCPRTPALSVPRCPLCICLL